MVHVLPLINISGFTPEFDKKNEFDIENRNGLLIEGAFMGHGTYKRYRWWCNNGQIWSDVNYKDGLPHGRYRVWNYDGKLAFNQVWDNGKRVKG